MPTIRSRQMEVPQTLVVALANLSIAQKNMRQLVGALRYQSVLFDNDVVRVLLGETADDVELHAETINNIKDELVDFMSNELRESK